MAEQKKRLGELLVESNIVTEGDIERALRYQGQYGCKIGQALVALNILTESKLLAALRYHFGLPVVDLSKTEIPPNIIRLVSGEMAERYSAVPLRLEQTKKGKTLFVVMSNPVDLNAIEELQFTAGYKISPVLARESDLQAALSKYYEVKRRPIGAISVSLDDDSDTGEMTIIQGGEEIKIVLDSEEKKELEKTQEEGPEKDRLKMNYEMMLKELKLWKAVVKLLINKGVITMKELEEALTKKDE
jgi:type IV pilus assembly protein PilB